MNLKDRTTLIKEKVSLKEFFDHVGISYQDISIPHQIRCPFHGIDSHASARFFPSQNGGSGSFWCWACNNGGDILWFAEQWYGLDHVVQACDKLEEEFNLARTQDDIVKEFYRDKHRFDDTGSHQSLIEQLLLLFEVKACGKTHKNDPEFEGWIPLLRNQVINEEFGLRFFDVERQMWLVFDSLLETLPKGMYPQAVSSLEEWESRFKRLLEEVLWEAGKATATKQELSQQLLTEQDLDVEFQSTPESQLSEPKSTLSQN